MGNDCIFVVDDDDAVRESLRALLESFGFAVREFSSARSFLEAYNPSQNGCLIVDIRMPGMDGLALQEEITARAWSIPVIVITGHGDVPLAVRAMKAGAIDFLEKPFDDVLLVEGVKRALAMANETASEASQKREAQERLATLTAREREVLDHLVAGRANKVIAHEMGISPRTVEIHRAHLSEKMRVRSLSELVRLTLVAGGSS